MLHYNEHRKYDARLTYSILTLLIYLTHTKSIHLLNFVSNCKLHKIAY